MRDGAHQLGTGQLGRAGTAAQRRRRAQRDSAQQHQHHQQAEAALSRYSPARNWSALPHGYLLQLRKATVDQKARRSRPSSEVRALPAQSV